MRLGYRDLVIALFAIGIILGLAFGTGTIYGRNSAPTPTPSAGGGGAGFAGGGAGGAGGAGRATTGQVNATSGPFGSQTLGTITAVQGSTFTVREPNGSTTTLAEDLNTQYTATTPGSASSLQPGDVVLVNPGPPNAEGQTIAESVLVLPASLASSLQAGGAAGSGAGAGAGGRPGASATPAR